MSGRAVADRSRRTPPTPGRRRGTPIAYFAGGLASYDNEVGLLDNGKLTSAGYELDDKTSKVGEVFDLGVALQASSGDLGGGLTSAMAARHGGRTRRNRPLRAGLTCAAHASTCIAWA